MTPFSLNDDELGRLLAVAGVIPRADRPAFLRATVRAFEGDLAAAMRQAQPDQAAERRWRDTAKKRRRRQRDATGEGVLSVPIDDLNALIGVLLDLGGLDEASSEDHHHIGVSAGRILSDLARLAATGTVLLVPIADLSALTRVLLDLVWLDEGQSKDRRHVGIAAGKILSDLAARTRPRGTDLTPSPGYFRPHE